MGKDSYQVDNLRVNRLTLRTLPELDNGEIESAFNLAVKQMVKSVVDDFGVDKKRELLMKVTMVPGRKHGQIEVGIIIGAVKLPGYIEVTQVITLNDRGEATFVDGGDRKEPDQRTIFETMSEKEEVEND